MSSQNFARIVPAQRPIDGEDREEKPEEPELDEKHALLRLARPPHKFLRQQAGKFFRPFPGQVGVIDTELRVE